MQLSIVIPCYNEAKNIPLILERFSKSITDQNIEVLLVNNGSTDDTAEVLDRLLPDYEFASSVLVPVNQGYGYGILQGLKAAKGEYLGWTHADLQTDPTDIIKVWSIIRERGERPVYVKGARKGRPLFDQFFTMGMGIFESFYFRMLMNDINAQPNVFPRCFYEKWDNPPYDFSLDLYAVFMAKKSGLEVVRFPVLFPERIHGKSSWNTGLKAKWKFIKRTISFSIELKRKRMMCTKT